MTAEVTFKPIRIEIQPWKMLDNGCEAAGRVYLHRQWLYRFPNGYGASVVMGTYTYGGPDGLFELAVIRFESPDSDKWDIDYGTPVTDDVIGWLDENGVAGHLLAIAAVDPSTPAVTSHQRLAEYGWDDDDDEGDAWDA